MKTLAIIQHLRFENLGSFEQTLSEHNFKFIYSEAGIDDLSRKEIVDSDLLIVLGGPIGANDEEKYPFIKHELSILKHRLQNNLPLLGICLGAQLMAKALGAKVYPASEKEIGWKPLRITDAGKKTLVMHFNPEKTSMFHWHGDTFDLPANATLLASTDVCQNQIYSYGETAIGFQCHPELIPASIERWFIGHAHEINTDNISVHKLRQITNLYGANLEQQSRAFLKGWLTKAGL